MWPIILKLLISSAVIVGVNEVSNRYPRLGGLLLTLPLVSILAFIMAWTRDHNLKTVSALSRETLVLVPLSLPFFIPLAFAERLGLSFWAAMVVGLLLASATTGAWLAFGPAGATP